MTEFTSSGLVRELAEYIYGRTRVDKSFAETCAAALISTAAGPEIIFSDEKGDLNLNIFGIIIGGSRISNKTVSLDIVRTAAEILSESLKKDLMTPEKFSIEGMSKYLRTNPEGLIVGDEFTSMIKDAGRQYLAASMEFLSKIYDGYIPKYTTIKRGTEEPIHNLHVSFLSATTYYILELMKDDSFFTQGTGCRFLWDLDLGDDSVESTDIEAASFFLTDDQRIKRDDELKALVGKLEHIREIVSNYANISMDEVVVMKLNFDSLAIIGKHMNKINRIAREKFREDKFSADYSYIAGTVENVIKLASIHCIGNIGTDKLPDEMFEISVEDVEWAIGKAEHHYQMYLKIKDLRDELLSDYSTRAHKSDFQRVLDCIQRKGGKATLTNIMQTTGWLTKDAQLIVSAMIHNKLIIGEKRTGMGPKTYEYRRNV